MELRPCPDCRRHVDVVELTCPFCATTLARTAPRSIRLGHVSRAVVFGASLSACWAGKSTAPPDPGHGSAGSGSATETNRVVPDDHRETHFAQPPDDAGIAAVDAPPDAALPDAAVKKVPDPVDWRKQRRNDGPCCKPYGAPPARRRLV